MSAPHLELALVYARLGWRVFPLFPIVEGHCGCGKGANCASKPGKHPRIMEWPKLATADEATIRAWWSRWPDAGIGIATGCESRLIVLDVDGAEGVAWLAEFEREHGALPLTATVSTGREGGGEHRYFRHVYPTLVSINTGKLDLKADRGFVVAPPSPHVSGKPYEWSSDREPARIAPKLAVALRAFIEAKAKGRKAEAKTAGAPASRAPKLPSHLKELALVSKRSGVNEAAGIVSTPDAYTEEAIEDLRDALALIGERSPERIDKRESWLAIGMGLHELTDHGWPEAVCRGLWDEVSIAAGFTGADFAAERDKDWVSFGRGYEGRKVTVATIFRWARNLGWRPAHELATDFTSPISDSATPEAAAIQPAAPSPSTGTPADSVELNPLRALFAQQGLLPGGASLDPSHSDTAASSKALAKGHDQPAAIPETPQPFKDAHDGYGQWPDAIDIFGNPTREPELTPDMLPKAIANFAFDEAERMGVEPAMIAMPAVAVCAAALHDKARIQPKEHDSKWTESARLWVAVIAPPGSKKTNAIGAAVAPLKEIGNEWRKAHKADIAKYLIAQAKWKKECKAGNPCPEPKQPNEKRLLVGDVTLEKLAHIEAHNDHGLLWLHDELMGLISSFDRYHGGKAGADRAAFLEGWNGGERTVDRVKDDGSIYVPNWSFNVLGGMQFDKLRAVASELQVDGALQRFLLFQGKDTLADGEEIDRLPDETAFRAYSDTIRKLVAVEAIAAIPFEELPAEPRPHGAKTVKLSPEAQHYRTEVRTVAAKLKGLPTTPGPLQTHLAKWDGLFARLLLTFHAVECVSRSEAVAPKAPYEVLAPEVPGETARQACELMLKFFLRHAFKLYVELFEPSQAMTDARRVARHILSGKLDRISTRDIKRNLRGFDKNDHALLSAMSTLSSNGWVARAEPLKQGGMSWRVNPSVHARYERLAIEERARSEAIHAKIASRLETAKKVL